MVGQHVRRLLPLVDLIAGERVATGRCVRLEIGTVHVPWPIRSRIVRGMGAPDDADILSFQAIGGSTRIVIEQGPSAGRPSTSPPLGKLSRAGRGGAPQPPRREKGGPDRRSRTSRRRTSPTPSTTWR